MRLWCYSMDLITHGVLTYKLVGKDKQTILAGIGPDAGWYLTYPVWLIFRKELKSAIATASWPVPPRWMVILHYFTHSFVTAVVVVLGIKLVTGRWHKKEFLAWILHIAVDIPTHSKEPWGPRFLWPVSAVAFEGISWAEVASKLVAREIRQRSQMPNL